ncbi:MAG: DUF2384 domain-containing protein [Lysobacter sp.]|nr:DUF2384 domain-containing protein [Lysobacter sp.]
MNAVVRPDERPGPKGGAAPNEAAGSTERSSWAILGGLFEKELHSEADVLGLVENGISTECYQAIVNHLQVPKGAIGAETTIRNRLKKPNERLNTEESERLVGIARVYASASSLFGTEQKALEWMHRPAKYLPDRAPLTPMALATLDAGVRLLEERLLRTAHGMY